MNERLAAIECYFHADEMSPSEVLEQQLIENLLREDLKPVEEARAYAALMELNGWTGKQVAERLRVPASQVSRALALLRLPDDIRQRVDASKIAAWVGDVASTFRPSPKKRTRGRLYGRTHPRILTLPPRSLICRTSSGAVADTRL